MKMDYAGKSPDRSDSTALYFSSKNNIAFSNLPSEKWNTTKLNTCPPLLIKH